MNKPKTYVEIVCLLTLLAGFMTAKAQPRPQTPPTQTTVVEDSQPLPRPPAGTLGTKSYEATDKEKPFFAKLSEDERTTGDMFESYSITGKKGKYVGWFGIVRKIEEDKTAQQTNLLVEMKYFDGLTDTHIQALSFNGAGDFTARLSGNGLGIKPLSLVKVYGVVTSETSNIPDVNAEYVRQWDWGLFTFLMVYGEQKGNKEWKKLNRASEDRIYNPFPNAKYYEDRLGPRPQ